jgi:hypothetical protein
MRPIAVLCLGLAVCAAVIHAKTLGVNETTLLESLKLSYAQLVSYYDRKTGFFGDDSGGVPLWTTANQLETSANYYAITQDASVLDIFENSYVRLKSRYACGLKQEYVAYCLK